MTGRALKQDDAWPKWISRIRQQRKGKRYDTADVHVLPTILLIERTSLSKKSAARPRFFVAALLSIRERRNRTRPLPC
jgi:hypothetical protein